MDEWMNGWMDGWILEGLEIHSLGLGEGGNEEEVT
jgi:hypothetical protein